MQQFVPEVLTIYNNNTLISTTIVYNYNESNSLWNGVWRSGATTIDFFDETQKDPLSFQGIFTNMINAWDAYTVFNM